ncbi:hypothetical protein GCM10011321_37790 [Youhaiella tibetensis]|jgi:hypothetical protein|uniref:DUF1223 domain-containing protein n=1 Tax=Paradevosia tibetensis TaxID=1447062 RepID=A0A5B9DSU3_9HYPH|nr:DUF1223 domain-containing protein [Youhaiella tibetensis]QEE22277.1 DUF1223 domain-containing protein [Youhaiella tibetensis]GGF43677.1 hypothetical protein GCM10011321_37790 [Youhaiella tibetensis]
MIFRPLLGTFLGLLLALPADALEVRVQPKAVLELFTSQGCASCPPADALLTKLAQRPDVIALSYHVDYWDYIGWPDTFGAKANTARQKDYATRWGSNRIYTPQMVVNGVKGVVGSRQQEIDGVVRSTKLTLPVALNTSDGMLAIDIEGQAGLADAVVWLVTYLDRADVAIERGENEGKHVTYTNVVTSRQAIGMWEPGAGAHLKLPLSEVMTGDSNGAVIIVQEEAGGLPGNILGAAAFQQ